MDRLAHLAGTSIAIFLVFSVGIAKADWCETSPGSGKYTDKGCDKAYDGARSSAPSAPWVNDPSLRDRLKKSLGSGSSNDQRAKIGAAIAEANSACAGGNMIAFEAQMSQMSSLGADAGTTSYVRQLCAAQRGLAGSATPGQAQPSPPQQATITDPASAAPAPDPNIFPWCGDPDRQGIQTCYEVPKSGYSCRKILKKGGDAVWTDDQATCDSNAVLELRNKYFNNLPKPTFGDGDVRREQALSRMPTDCRAELNKLLQGADARDAETAYAAYAALRSSCDAGMKQLARAAELQLPERIMSSRAKRLQDRAFAGDQGRVPDAAAAAAIAQGRNDNGSYDAEQVIDFGLALLGVVSGFAGVYAPSPTGAFARSMGNAPVRGTYGQGGPTRIAPRTSPSCITTSTGRYC